MPLFPVPLDCSSSIYPGLRLLCPGSASAFSPPLPDLGWAVSRGGNVRFMLRPGGLLALHRQELLLSSFRFLGSPPESVEYNYPAKQSIAGAGFSPARHAALWAASRGRRGRRERIEHLSVDLSFIHSDQPENPPNPPFQRGARGDFCVQLICNHPIDSIYHSITFLQNFSTVKTQHSQTKRGSELRKCLSYSPLV